MYDTIDEKKLVTADIREALSDFVFHDSFDFGTGASWSKADS